MSLQQQARTPGRPIVLKDYVRFQLGEGIEKEVERLSPPRVAATAGVNKGV